MYDPPIDIANEEAGMDELDNQEDHILVENGEMFDGTRSQFRDCFFDNANDYEIISWCEQHKWSLKINGEIIL